MKNKLIIVFFVSFIIHQLNGYTLSLGHAAFKNVEKKHSTTQMKPTVSNTFDNTHDVKKFNLLTKAQINTEQKIQKIKSQLPSFNDKIFFSIKSYNYKHEDVGRQTEVETIKKNGIQLEEKLKRLNALITKLKTKIDNDLKKFFSNFDYSDID